MDNQDVFHGTVSDTNVTYMNQKETQMCDCWGAGAAMPPEEIIDFILDRPFIFAIDQGVPLFVGTINQL